MSLLEMKLDVESNQQCTGGKSFKFTNVVTRNVANAIKLKTMIRINIYPVGDITEVSDNLIKV